MLDSKFILGISGLSRSGKDTFCTLFTEEFPKFSSIPIYIDALAKPLKEEVQDILLKNFNYDVWTQDTEEKKKIRDFLTIWADMRRKSTNGLYFINLLKDRINKIKEKSIILVSDVRFAEYEYDEAHFIKENGLLIHIEKIIYPNSILQPPNKFERENDPKLISMSDYKLIWVDKKTCPYQVNLGEDVKKIIYKLMENEQFNKFT